MSAERHPNVSAEDVEESHEIALAEDQWRRHVKVGKGVLIALSHPLLALHRKDLIHRGVLASASVAEQIDHVKGVLQNPRVQGFHEIALHNLHDNRSLDEVRHVVAAPAHEYYRYRPVSDEAAAVMDMADAIASGQPRRVFSFSQSGYAENHAAASRLAAFYDVCGIDIDQRVLLKRWGDESVTQAFSTDFGVEVVERYEPGYIGVATMVQPGVVIPNMGAHPPRVSLTIS